MELRHAVIVRHMVVARDALSKVAKNPLKVAVFAGSMAVGNDAKWKGAIREPNAIRDAIRMEESDIVVFPVAIAKIAAMANVLVMEAELDAKSLVVAVWLEKRNYARGI